MNPTQANEQPAGDKKPSKFSRRKLLIGAAATLGGVGLAGLGTWWWNRGSNRPAMTVTSGYIPIVDCTPIPIAYEKGFFAEMGLRAEKPTLIRTWDALLEAFASEQILLTHILLFQLIFMRYERNILFGPSRLITKMASQCSVGVMCGLFGIWAEKLLAAPIGGLPIPYFSRSAFGMLV